MQFLLGDPLFGGAVQNGRHLLELVAAFGLTTLIGLERTIQGKSAELRTQTIVGTSAALIMLISKYGFADVIVAGTVVLDPSRVAAQIVSGIGFLGAGLIITRRGAVHGLTTAAAVWESAAIGMAAGAGLLLLASAVVTPHFVSALPDCAGPPGCKSSTKTGEAYCGRCCGCVDSASGNSPSSMPTPTTSMTVKSG
jgi:putative Mg2+ transporter-C (MgtC) family protein